ncbi:MAG: hypothetical protein P1U81_14340 [Verrucomicrobiales bacterium]|nr:hypothetical protein [bacterium]MDF2377419.1 hypothetical protein [Verrucomicrobiales bacterium]
MKAFLGIALAVFIAGACTSCVRTSTVVKLEKDGSGEIITRYHFSPQVTAFLEQVEAMGPRAGIPMEAANLGLIREIMTPDEEGLTADAKNYGEGVSYSRHEIGKDTEGWEGYIVVYDFDDIRKIVIDQNTLPGKAKELMEARGQAPAARKGGSLRFELEGDLLTIHSSLADGNVNEIVNGDQLSKAKEMGMKPSEAIQMAANTTQGMRTGFFVRVVPGIAETNAEHTTGDLIILSDAEISKVLKDPDFGAFVDEAMEDPEGVDLEKVKELFRKIEGMTVELAEEVTVRFQ